MQYYIIEPYKPFISIYKIQPHFSYCYEIWNVLGETQSIRLQKLHNSAVRIIAHEPNPLPERERK